MEKHIHLFSTQEEFEAERENNYKKPWLSFTSGGSVGYNKKLSDYDFNGHDYIDLGLPSGILWATCNVDALHPEETGGYYAFGETETKETYSWDNYMWCIKSGSTVKFTKYYLTDGKKVLEKEDDVACVKMGGDWRMPRVEEILELVRNTTQTEVLVNGTNCVRFTGPNGNTMLLPICGSKQGNNIKDGNLYILPSSTAYINIGKMSYCIKGSGDTYTYTAINKDLGVNVRGIIL